MGRSVGRGEGGQEGGAGRGIWQRVGGQQEVGDGGGGKGEVEKNGKIRGILQMDMMECLGGHRL